MALMRASTQPIARRANDEDQCTGRFWEGASKVKQSEDNAVFWHALSMSISTLGLD